MSCIFVRPETFQTTLVATRDSDLHKFCYNLNVFINVFVTSFWEFVLLSFSNDLVLICDLVFRVTGKSRRKEREAGRCVSGS